MRRTMLLSVIAVACLAGATLYLYPQVGDRAKQLLAGALTELSGQQSQSAKQTQSGRQSQSGQQAQGASGRRGGAGGGPVAVATAVSNTAGMTVEKAMVASTT